MPILATLALTLSPALLYPTEPRSIQAEPVSVPARGALPDAVDELLAAGRKLFAEGKLDEALRVFREAEKLDGASLRTRVFVLRVAIAQGQIEDVLLEADGLKQAGKLGVELDYLYGMAFYSMAARDIAAGQTTAVTGSQFEDAIRSLKLVAARNDARFEDAWVAMAESAWYAQDIETGRQASEKAVELAPNDPWRRLLRGKLALAAYALLAADASTAADGEAHWDAAIEAFEKAIALCGTAPDTRLLPAAVQGCSQLGTTYLWKQKREEASEAFERAIVLDPSLADYRAISAAFAGQELLDLLERAHTDWSAKHPASDSGDATLLWWLGFANYGIKLLPQAEKAFERARAKNPAFTNTLYYLFRVRFEQRESAKSLETLHQYQALDPDGLLASLAYDVAGNTARLESSIAWSMDEEQHGGKQLLLEAAFACELITKIVPRESEHSRHWNNLGLFLRDEGDRLRGTQGALEASRKPFDEAQVNKLWENSLVAYEIALELEPRNPNYLNDTAVMLHYYLLRDLERAKLMYSQGFEEATALLKRTDLTPQTRDAVEIALRDTRNNVKLVQKLIDKRAAGAGAKKGDKPLNQ